MNTIHKKALRNINRRLLRLEDMACCTGGFETEIRKMADYHLKTMDFIADTLTQAHEDAFKAGILAGQKAVGK